MCVRGCSSSKERRNGREARHFRSPFFEPRSVKRGERSENANLNRNVFYRLRAVHLCGCSGFLRGLDMGYVIADINLPGCLCEDFVVGSVEG